MDRRSFSIYLRLTPDPPEAQRLRQVVWSAAAEGCEALFIDWGSSFPWSVDTWSSSVGRYREELVPGLDREARARGMALHTVFPAVHELEFLAGLEEYRRAFVEERGRHVLDLSRSEGRLLGERLVEDLVSLLPDSGIIMVNWLLSARFRVGPEALNGLFSPHSPRLLLRPLGSPATIPLLRDLIDGSVHGLQGVVLPPLWPGTTAERGVAVLREHRLRAGRTSGSDLGVAEVGRGDPAPAGGNDGPGSGKPPYGIPERIATTFEEAGEASLLVPEPDNA